MSADLSVCMAVNLSVTLPAWPRFCCLLVGRSVRRPVTHVQRARVDGRRDGRTDGVGSGSVGSVRGRAIVVLVTLTLAL